MANLMYQTRGVQTNTREFVSQRQSGGKVLQDNRQNSKVNQLMTNAPVQRVSEEEEPLQGKFANQSTAQLEQQPTVKPNNTGLPDNLKSGIESLSGMSMDNVRVHYNSAKPAQLNALAYAQGTDIHVAPGQEKHLPHEAWHVVQQAQGRVKPTMQMKEGVPVNDDKGLEHEADVMGGRAVQMTRKQNVSPANSLSAFTVPVVQRTVWEWKGEYWLAIRTEGYPTAQPDRSGKYINERFSTGEEQDLYKKLSAEKEKEEEEKGAKPKYPNVYMHKKVLKNINYYGNIDFDALNRLILTGTHGKNLTNKPEHIKLAGGYAITAVYKGGKAYITDCGGKDSKSEKYKWEVSGETDYQSSSSTDNQDNYTQDLA